MADHCVAGCCYMETDFVKGCKPIEIQWPHLDCHQERLARKSCPPL